MNGTEVSVVLLHYTVRLLTLEQVAYPSLAYNTPPGGAINGTTSPATSANYLDHLISVQSVVIDPIDRLWVSPSAHTVGRQYLM